MTLSDQLKSCIFGIGTKFDGFEDLDIIFKYFTNLQFVDLSINYLSISEFYQIVKNWKVNNLIFKGIDYDNNEYSIESKFG